MAISVGVIVLFVDNFFIALGQPSGTPGNVRMLQFLSPATVTIAAVLILAVALVAFTRGVSAADPGDPATPVSGANVRSIAGFVSGAVAAAAFVRAIVALTVSHERALLKLGTMIDALAAVLVATVGAYWALRPRLRK